MAKRRGVKEDEEDEHEDGERQKWHDTCSLAVDAISKWMSEKSEITKANAVAVTCITNVQWQSGSGDILFALQKGSLQ